MDGKTEPPHPMDAGLGHVVCLVNGMLAELYTINCVCVCVCVCVCACSLTQSCLTLWDPMDRIALQAPLSMRFSRREYRLPFPPPGDLPDAGIGPVSPAFADELFTTEPPGKPHPGV